MERDTPDRRAAMACTRIRVWIPRHDAHGRRFDPFASLTLHRVATDLAQLATDYDLRCDGAEVLDRLAGICEGLDSVAADIWRDSVADVPGESADEVTAALCRQMCALLRGGTDGAAASGEPVETCCGPDAGNR